MYLLNRTTLFPTYLSQLNSRYQHNNLLRPFGSFKLLTPVVVLHSPKSLELVQLQMSIGFLHLLNVLELARSTLNYLYFFNLPPLYLLSYYYFCSKFLHMNTREIHKPYQNESTTCMICINDLCLLNI